MIAKRVTIPRVETTKLQLLFDKHHKPVWDINFGDALTLFFLLVFIQLFSPIALVLVILLICSFSSFVGILFICLILLGSYFFAHNLILPPLGIIFMLGLFGFFFLCNFVIVVTLFWVSTNTHINFWSNWYKRRLFFWKYKPSNLIHPVFVLLPSYRKSNFLFLKCQVLV